MNDHAQNGAGTPRSFFHLVPDPLAVSLAPVIAVPERLSAWAPQRTGLAPLPSLAPGSPHLILEPLRRGFRRQLLLIDRGRHAIRCNGFKVPSLLLLKIGDQFQVDDGAALELALYQTGALGALPPDRGHLRCASCHQALAVAAAVYHCACCSQLLHVDCAESLSRCPTCAVPVRFEEGYPIQPSFLLP